MGPRPNAPGKWPCSSGMREAKTRIGMAGMSDPFMVLADVGRFRMAARTVGASPPLCLRYRNAPIVYCRAAQAP